MSLIALAILAGCFQTRGPLEILVANEDNVDRQVHVDIVRDGAELVNQTTATPPQSSIIIANLSQEGTYHVTAWSEGGPPAERTVDFSRPSGPDAITVEVRNGAVQILIAIA